jgi:hypothetical protein
MFIGHYAVGFAAKKAAPKVSLGTLFLSVQLLDLFWPIFLLAGVEHVRIDPGNTPFTPLDFYDYPISHSLVAVLGWSLLFGLIYFFMKKYQRGAWVLGLGVLSHWILDFVTHRADLPIVPGSSAFVGLGLWYSFGGTIVVEGLLFLLGVALYAHATVAKDKAGKYGFWSLVGFLGGIWVANLFSPPPPNVMALASSALFLWILVPWGYWIDRHREMVPPEMESHEQIA